MPITTDQYEAMKAKVEANRKPDAKVRREILDKIAVKLDEVKLPPGFGLDPISLALKPPQWITVPGPCVPKPRMTQRDKWAKRPCVMRYREYCDRVRAAIPIVKEGAIQLRLHFWIDASRKWDDGQPHLQRPDVDNICKSVLDALFDDDSRVWKIIAEKRWCEPGHERTEIAIL